MMKKLAIFLVAALMTTFAAVAETAEETVMLEGVVVEIMEDGSLLVEYETEEAAEEMTEGAAEEAAEETTEGTSEEAAEEMTEGTAEEAIDETADEIAEDEEAVYQQVQVLISDETVFETNADIEAGDYVYVDYSGAMTMSLPGQISAQVIRMHRLTGDVVEYDAENNGVLLNTEENGEVYVNLPMDWEGVEVDSERMTVWFDGAMTMSLPGQISAGMAMPGYILEGSITQLNADSMLIGEGDEAIQVNFDEGMLPEGLEVNDVVSVTYDGMMTRSLPAQVYAMEIVELSR